ncbi:hypothetical protein BHM03_00034530, partial [Ensete ventricosum]
MRIARYRAVRLIGAVSAPLTPEIDRQRSISTIAGRCWAVTIDFDRWWPISGGISRWREKEEEEKKWENLESDAALSIHRPWVIFSLRGSSPAQGEGTRR